MSLDIIGTTIGAWALTFAVHSTVLLLGAALLDRRLRDRPEVMSPVWKLAALGGLLTATVQLSFGVEPLAGRMIVDAPAQLEPRPTRAPAIARPVVLAANELPTTFEPSEPELEAVPLEPLAPIALASTAPSPVPARSPSWLIRLAGALTFGAAFGLATIVYAWLRLRTQLHGRRRAAAPLHRMLAELLARTRRAPHVHLSVSPNIGVPLATGVLRPEIVVPERAALSLTASAQRSMLAHELAHVLRRDPSWRLALLVLERVLFFQPLLGLARRRVTQYAEYLSDAWAVRNTDQPLELARCLTEIAGWMHPRTALVLASGMAEPRSILGRRVLRLVEPQRTPSRSRALPWLAVAGLFATVMVAPSIGLADEPAHVLHGDAVAGVPMMWVVHEDGRVGGGAQISPPGLPAHAAVLAARPSESKPAQRRAERAVARERRATETALRRTIRSAHAQDRLPSIEELAIVLEHGEPAQRRHVASLRVQGDADALVVVLEGMPELPGDVARQLESAGVHFEISGSPQVIAQLDADHQRKIVVAQRVAAARERQARSIERDVRRRVERDVRRDVERALEQAGVAGEIGRRAREHALEQLERARQDAARGRGRGRRGAPPRVDIAPIAAPMAPMPPVAPMPPTAVFAPPAPPAPAHPRLLAPPAPPTIVGVPLATR